MPILPTGLVRDKSSGVYYLRRRIPTEILSCFPGKKEQTLSLRTKEFKIALERHRQEEAKLTVEWNRHIQKIRRLNAQSRRQSVQKIDTLTPEIIDAICGRFEISSLTSDDIQRHEEQYDAEDIEAYKEGYAGANSILRTAVAIGDTRVIRPLLEQFLYLSRLELNVSEPEMRHLALAYARTAIRVNEKLLKRYEGEDVPTPEARDIRTTPMLSEVTHAYMAYYERLNKPEMLKKVNAVMPLLLQMVGNKPIGSLTQTDITTFFDDVQTLPPRWKDYCRVNNVTPKEASARRVGELSKGTFDGTYVATIGPFLDYCRSRWQDQGWPVSITIDGIRYVGGRAEPENGQRAFKPKELKRLFEGPEMEGFANCPSEAHKFWLPHLGLFTGARANELCQLNPQCDIRKDEESGIWFLDITSESQAHEEITKVVKNRVSRRRVPIHQTLIELGFLDYVAQLKSAGEKLLFPGFPPSVGRAAPKAGEWFIDLLKQTGLRDETPGARLVGMHAFRYTVSNQGEELGVVNTGFASILDDPITIIFIGINICLTYYFTKVNFNRFAVSHGPEILTTVGILGCFTGIAIALLNFDASKVSTSVPHLLGGVKTAFLASVSGVAGSLLIRYKHHRHGGPIPQSPGAVKAASIDDLVEATRALQASLAGKEEGSLLSQMKLMRQEQSDQLQGLRGSFDTFAARMAEDNSKALIEALEGVIRDFNTKLSEQFGSNFAKLNSAVELLVTWQQQYRDELDKLQTVQQTSAGDLSVAAASLSVITSQAEAYTDTAARLQELLSGLAQQHTAIQDSQRSLVTVLVEMKDVAPQFAKKLDELTESMGAGVLKVQTEVADVVRTLGNQVQGSNAEMKQLLTETLKKAQRETNEELAKSVELIHNGVTVLDKALQEELTKSLDTLGRQLAALSEKFVADYLPLTERLREVVRMAGQH